MEGEKRAAHAMLTANVDDGEQFLETLTVTLFSARQVFWKGAIPRGGIVIFDLAVSVKDLQGCDRAWLARS